MDSLPVSNYETLKRMCVHMSLITEHESSNKMGVQNLAIVFAPTLVSGEGLELSTMQAGIEIMEKLITYHEWIFRMEEKSNIDINIQEARRKVEAAQNAAPNETQVTVCDIFIEDTEESVAVVIDQNINLSLEIFLFYFSNSGNQREYAFL